MDRIAQLKENLRQTIGAKPVLPVFGIVKSVEGDTCTVDVNGLELSDIRLKTTADSEETLLIIPTVGSHVMMISAGGTIDNLTVVKCDHADRILAKNADFQMEIDLVSGKIGAKNATTGLFELFDQLQNILKLLKVYTPSGPSGTPLPDSIERIEEFESDFKTILKQL